MNMGNGEEVKFQPGRWMTMMENPEFKARVLEIMEEEVILNFKNREGDSKDFYDVDGEEE